MGSTSSREYEIRFLNGDFVFRQYDLTSSNSVSITYVGNITIVQGQWYHITATSDGNGGLNIYVNNDETTNSIATDGTYIAMHNLSDSFRLGEFYGGIDLNGKMDVVRLWNVKLSQLQITEISTKELAGIDINP